MAANTKNLPLKPKSSSGYITMHTKCIFRLTLTHYKQDYLFRYKKKHNLKIKGNLSGQMVNIRSKNGVMREVPENYYSDISYLSLT